MPAILPSGRLRLTAGDSFRIPLPGVTVRAAGPGSAVVTTVVSREGREHVVIEKPAAPLTAREFVAQLPTPPARKGDVFALAKRFIGMDLDQIEELLDSPDVDARTGAVSIMDFQARRRSTPPDRRRDLYELYLRRHDRIDDWSLVDRAAPSVVGGYLDDKPRDPLYRLARSESVWERRTAITATWHFIRQGQLDDTFAIATLLVDDREHLIHTAVGGWVREAGKRDIARLRAFLDAHAATMPRTALRFAIEHFDPDERQHYRNLGTPTH